jgi:hypothetical protein
MKLERFSQGGRIHPDSVECACWKSRMMWTPRAPRLINGTQVCAVWTLPHGYRRAAASRSQSSS